MARQKGFICDRINPLTGKICGQKCGRRWNLQRHINEKHQALRFINYVPSANGLRLLPSDSEGKGEPDGPDEDGDDDDDDKDEERNLGLGGARHEDTPLLAASTSKTPPTEQVPTVLPTPTQRSVLPPIITGELAQEKTISTSLSNADLTPPWLHRNIKRCRDLCSSADKEDVPTYQVKRSKTAGAQQLAIQWLTQVAKNHFDKYLDATLAQWGVKPSHTGTCVLLPADWAALDPLTIADLFSAQSCPHEQEDQELAYKYSDHSTSITRAIAWFKSWPRTGIELDNFLGCGPYKAMHGSHLCHHHLCGVHLIYESAEKNASRKQCHSRSKFLREESLPIPEDCCKHHPPCKMQHAALTTLEVCFIQMNTLRHAKGLPALPPPVRPHWHVYPTFEHQLPLKPGFCGGAKCAVRIDPVDVAVNEPIGLEGKPILVCPFCPNIKSFQSIIGLWSHFVHRHAETDNADTYTKTIIQEDDLVREVRRTAALWREYWKTESDGGKKNEPTMLKLHQIASEDFTWATVLSWGLR